MTTKFTPRTFKRMIDQQIEGTQINDTSWHVPSATRFGVTYIVTVRLARPIKHIDNVAAALETTCTCESRISCKHRLQVQRQYNSDLRLLMRLLGLPATARMRDLAQALNTKTSRAA